MTSPGPLYEPSGAGRKNWLLRYLGVQEKYDAAIATALADAAEDAERGILAHSGDGVGKSVRRYQLTLAHREVRTSIKLLFRHVYDTISAGQSEAAVAAREAGFKHDERFMRRLFRGNPQKRADWEDSMRQAANRGVQAMMGRVLGASYVPLSKQVYSTRALANGKVDRIINSALAKGDSQRDLAKAVKDSINPNTPGGVGYAAKRLARTEINNAYHAQASADNAEKPWVEYVEWRLSKTHLHVAPGGKLEICESYAERKNWPKDNVPKKPHPNCLCYTVPVLEDYEHFEMQLLAGFYDDYIDRNL